MANSINHWVIHWFLIDRDGVALTKIEQFHLKIFEKYKSFIMTNFDKITISFAKTEKTDPMLIQYIKNLIKLMFDEKKIDFQVRNNNQKSGEFDTFKDNVLANIGSSEKILYTHIKGVYRTSVTPILLKRELVWIWGMYQVVFSTQTLNSLEKFVMAGPNFSIYDNAFHTIKTNKWNPQIHIYRTYLMPLKKELAKIKDSNKLIEKYLSILPNSKDNLPWAYLGTFYWINAEKLGSYINNHGFSKEDIIAIANEFQNHNRPPNMYSGISKLNGHIEKMTFANNVSEYFLPSIVRLKDCSFFKLKDK